MESNNNSNNSNSNTSDDPDSVTGSHGNPILNTNGYTRQQYQTLIDAIIATLATPHDYTTTVQKNYSNDRTGAMEIQAYAKISGRNWTYYVKDLQVTIGRSTMDSPPNTVDIDLGPAKMVSRKHVIIQFNIERGGWELIICGRNGAKINFRRILRPSNKATVPVPLSSGTILDVGGTQMMFILPDQDPMISLTTLNHVAPKLVDVFKTSGGSSTPNNALLYDIIRNNQNIPIALENNDRNNKKRDHKHSDAMDSVNNPTNNTDLSKDENKNIKPAHSYATMITQAILSTEEGVISLADIYKFISSHYAYYRYAKSGWQNSIRHNLSLNKAFSKVPRKPNEPGKGMKWTISKEYQDDFMNKWNTGKISKIRRGSSVARQLQLHMSKHNSLPMIQGLHQPPRSKQPPQDPSVTETSRAAPNLLRPSDLFDPINRNPTNNALVSFTNASKGQHKAQSNLKHLSHTTHSPIASISSSTSSSSSSPSSLSAPVLSQTVPGSTSTLFNNKLPSVNTTSVNTTHDNMLHSPTRALQVTQMEAYTPDRGTTARCPVKETSNMTTYNNGNNTNNHEENTNDLDNTQLSATKMIITPSLSHLLPAPPETANTAPTTACSAAATSSSANSTAGRSSPSVWHMLQFGSMSTSYNDHLLPESTTETAPTSASTAHQDNIYTDKPNETVANNDVGAKPKANDDLKAQPSDVSMTAGDNGNETGNSNAKI